MPSYSHAHINPLLPEKTYFIAGQPVTLTLPLNIWPQPSVQWQVSRDSECTWINLSNKSLTLVISNPVEGNFYRALIKTKCDCWFTNATKLVQPFLEIIQQPVSTCFKLCETAVFKIKVKGKPAPSIQWQVSSNNGLTWVDIPNATETKLKVKMTQQNKGFIYRAVVENGFQTLLSDTVSFFPGVLKVDDGEDDTNPNLNIPQQLLWLNVFTPSSYPFTLQEIQIYFRSGVNVQVGDPIDFYVWTNPGVNPDPSVDAVLQLSLTGQQVKALDIFNSYLLPNPINVTEGSVLIGAVNRLPVTDPRYPNYGIVSLDTDNPQFRSWVSTGYPGPNPPNPPFVAPNPPFIPGPVWGTIETVTQGGISGNFMIRGYGCGSSNVPSSGSLNQRLGSTKPQEAVNNLTRGLKSSRLNPFKLN